MKLDLELPPFRVTGPAISQIETVGGVVRIDLVDGSCCGTAYDVGTGPAQDGDYSFGCEGAPSRQQRRGTCGAVRRHSRLRLTTEATALPGAGQPQHARGELDCRAKLPMPWD